MVEEPASSPLRWVTATANASRVGTRVDAYVVSLIR